MLLAFINIFIKIFKLKNDVSDKCFYGLAEGAANISLASMVADCVEYVNGKQVKDQRE